jgi:hypothetical protein
MGVKPLALNAAGDVIEQAVARAGLAPDAKNWEFLGRLNLATAAINSGTLTLSGLRRWLRVYVFISGYAGSGGVARLRFGAGAAVDAGANYAENGGENGAAFTARTALVGLNSGGSAIVGPRLTMFEIYNLTAQVKRVRVSANSGSVVAATAPTDYQASGIWVNTTAQIDRLDLNSYSLVTGTTAGGNLLANTEIFVEGRDTD